MNSKLGFLVSLVALLFSFPAMAGETPKRPNIILIMADDLGYGDLGCYGQTKIKTPHLDTMAKQGVRFTQFYSGSPVCAPSRCVLMTGLHSGHAFIRDNREQKPEGQLPIPENTVTIASLLKAGGYRTGIIGKWGLGMFTSSGDPLKHGFDQFFGYNCQRHAHSHYPTYLYRQDKRIDLPGNTGQAPSKSHSHDLLEAEALQFIKDNKNGPFFLYLPVTIPHVSLHIPEEDLQEYKGAFEETPFINKKGMGYQGHLTPRAAYAAMISRLDRSVGRILALLRELNLDDNTIVLFTSDNGPVYPGVGGSDPLFFRSAGLFREYKGSAHEGGLRVPMIVRWPGTIPAGKTSDHIAAFQDVLPTLCALAGAKVPSKTDGLSFAPTILGKGDQKIHPYLYFEFNGYGGQQAVRMGDWKAVRKAIHKGNLDIELYNLKDDLGETKNLAKDRPEIMARIREILVENHTPSPVFVFKALDGGKEQRK